VLVPVRPPALPLVLSTFRERCSISPRTHLVMTFAPWDSRDPPAAVQPTLGHVRLPNEPIPQCCLQKLTAQYPSRSAVLLQIQAELYLGLSSTRFGLYRFAVTSG